MMYRHPMQRTIVACAIAVATRWVYSESQKSTPLKLLAIFLLRQSVFPSNFVNLLPVYIHAYLPISVNLS